MARKRHGLSRLGKMDWKAAADNPTISIIADQPSGVAMPTTDNQPDAVLQAPGGRRARGGADARRAARSRPKLVQLPFITRKIPLVTVLEEEGLHQRR